MSTTQLLRHASGSAVPGANPAPASPPMVSAPQLQRTQERRGVADTPSAPVRHSAMPANASSAPPSRDDELKSSIDGWEGPRNLDYWKLKAESADRAAKRSRGIDPDGNRAGSVAARSGGGSPGQNIADGDGSRPGNSSSGGSGQALGDSGESRSIDSLSESGGYQGTPDYGGAF